MNYTFINKITGWTVFAIASIVYLLTIEDTASLWDCGEYITAAYKLEVGHPPGAPLYMLLGRLFSFFAAPENVAYCINALSAFSSSFTILFMFWSLTILLKKFILQTKEELEDPDKVAIFVSATIASLAYTFSESFWFSAVEGEVYAMASLFTAVIFWAILKWDEEMALYEKSAYSNGRSPNKWLLLIMFLLGLAIGVHLLGILVIPAIGYVIYFRVKKTTPQGFVVAGLASIFILGFIQEGIIPGTISLASKFEVSFVNDLGLPFYSGSILFFALLIGVCVWAVRNANKRRNTLLANSLMGLIFLLIGYGSFAVIVIRSNANTPLDENDPENLVTLHSYLKREQYGSAPLLKGQYWNSEMAPQNEWNDLSAYYLRRWVVTDGTSDLKAFVDENDALKYAEKEDSESLTVVEKYFESNASIRKGATPTYSQTTIFPRMYSSTPRHISGYKYWSGYNPYSEGSDEIGADDNRIPTFGENLRYFFNYQVNWMYFRYFMWNFAGRQNDIQGHGDNMRGNWISGIGFIDDARLGSQADAPSYTENNKSNNKFYFIPLIFALIGLVFHYRKSPKDAFVLTLAFIFTGFAILIYLNQKPFEPRERDYAYAGSFYFFAMWIAFGVYAIIDFLKNKIKVQNANVRLSAGALIGLIVPFIMGSQGWDDHNRNGKTTARDLAKNYLASCEKNGIIFTNGDNDTFPLWYAQEVEGFRTDVRVCNLSLMGTDWYTNQMKMKAYESAPLPIKFTEDQILMYGGTTDQLYFTDLYNIVGSSDIKLATIKEILTLRLENGNNENVARIKFPAFKNAVQNVLYQLSVMQPSTAAQAQKLTAYLNSNSRRNFSDSIAAQYMVLKQLYPQLESKLRTYGQGDEAKYNETIGALNLLSKPFENFESGWDSIDLTKAMRFVREDKGVLKMRRGSRANIFPAQNFTLGVNKENALKAGIINNQEFERCPNEITISYSGIDRISREEIMMLDILSNFNWERGLYFSSNRGSKFATRLLQKGYVKQVGVAYELNPCPPEKPLLKNEKQNFFNVEKMYSKLMKEYEFGEMANPDVLTDYYARRHTSHYRTDFLLLAEQLYYEGDNERAIRALDRSLKLMPVNTVIDFGEITGNDPITSLDYNRIRNNSYSPRMSGCLYEYVQLYALMGETKKATSLGKKLLKIYSSVFAFFENSDATIAIEPGTMNSNRDDLFAAADACFKMQKAVKGMDFEQEVTATINNLYEKILPEIDNELSTLGLSENMDALNQLFKEHMANMASEYNYTLK